jgi:hypothetical protein
LVTRNNGRFFIANHLIYNNKKIYHIIILKSDGLLSNGTDERKNLPNKGEGVAAKENTSRFKKFLRAKNVAATTK